jgi:hypothetical protein
MSQPSLKHWLKLLFVWKTKANIECMASEIACQCRTTLVKNVIFGSKKLSEAQIRGYVRAHARGCLESVIRHQVAIGRLDHDQVTEVTYKAKEILIAIVVCDLKAMSPARVTGIAAAA